MYLIESNNKFFEKHLIELFLQKSIDVTNDSNSKFYERIYIDLQSHTIKVIKREEIMLTSKLPISTEILFNKISDFLSKIFINFQDALYYPLSQKLEYQNKFIKLGIIHNTIFSICFLNLKQGVDKFQLYKSLWPEDKEIYMNKLDTHLTNLKTKIKTDLLKEIKLITKDSKLYLVSN